MFRTLFRTFLLAVIAVGAFAQDPPPPPPPPVETAPPATPVVMVTAQPLAPADFNSPYASPRDAARHRSQATLAELAANRNLKDALRGFEQALIDDRTYALAAFDLGIIAAISEKWDDAVAAFEDASRLAPSTFGSAVAPQLERLRVIAKLEKSAEGRRKRAYDEALLPLLRKLPSLSASDANSALAELGRIDPKRWEAPALLAALNGDGSGYQTSSKFLEIAAANATDPSVKHALEAAHKAAERELLYNSMRADAEAADDRGDYPKAAELYQSAWSSIPARVENGLEAVSALLLCDDTEHASALLVRLRESKDPSVEAPAGAMLKELAAVEPAANATSSDAAQFFREPGPREPVRIASMIPPIDPKPLEIYMRPLPKLQEDNEPVVVLAAMAVDAPANVPLPALPNPSVAGDNPWREVTAAQPKPAAESPRAVQAVDLSNGSSEPRMLQVTSEPAGARVFLGTSPDPACQTPCNIRLVAGEYPLRLSLDGYREVQQNIDVHTDLQDVAVPMEVLRGSVLIQTSAPGSVKVNGTAVGAESSPVELSMAPGLYRIGADTGSAYRERLLTIKPGARLRLELGMR